MRNGTLWATLALGVLVAACDSGDPLGPTGTAAVSGTVESEHPNATTAPGTASASSPDSAPGSILSGDLQARTVAIGEVPGGGQFRVLAEAEVDAQGRYRIEGVPAGRTELVIRARSDTGAEVGSVVLHEATVGGGEHRAHPIDARSTLHARVWSHVRASGQGSQGMGSAELALFLNARTQAAGAAAVSAAQVEALASATIQAQQAISAVLASEGHAMNAQARNALLLSLAAQRDRDRDTGVSPDQAHASYLSAAVSALAEGGVSAQALAAAYAAGATAIHRVLVNASTDAHIDVVRQGLLLNINARQRAAATAEATFGLRAEVVTALARMESRVRTAVSLAELRAAIQDERTSLEGGVVVSILANLPAMPIQTVAAVESELRAAIAAADLRPKLDGASNVSAIVQAVAAFRTQVNASAAAFVQALPAAVAASVSAEAVARLLLCFGAEAEIG